MEKEIYNLEVNTTKTYLSSEMKIFKTERFLFQTKKISEINFFILKIAESIESKLADIKKTLKSNVSNIYRVSTIDENFVFFVQMGLKDVQGVPVGKNDIIFVGCKEFQGLRLGDQRVNFFLRQSKIFAVNISSCQFEYSTEDLKKLYLISSSEYVNFPLLSKRQSELVEIEKQNVLLQGVAGSGKTNICYSKIIFTACRNYSGKILYTTFSRGLLIDTKNKIEFFKNSIKNLVDDYKLGRIVFLDKDHKKAIENRLGLFIVADTEINVINKLEKIIFYLENNVDYKLISDLYKDYFNSEMNFCDEEMFEKVFLKNVSNHQLKGRLEKIKGISNSVIYKEIYGMIFGSFKEGEDKLSLEEYKLRRKDSFSESECETIYLIATEFEKFQKTQNLFDNNVISRKILNLKGNLMKYSIVIADEVQDFTQVNLNLLKAISIKMFCVGDALQMINPSYFSFAYLKKLMYNEDVTSVIELKANYRNNKKIVEILRELSKINIDLFGTHSFVVESESIDEIGASSTVFTHDMGFLRLLSGQKFENFTFLVASDEEKQALRKTFKKQEILTISEVKGLERETIVILNVLSSNKEKWNTLERTAVNHKQADENSVYRYYFNLFYVGLSRGKHNIFVVENEIPETFNKFFKENFEVLDGEKCLEKFSQVVNKLEIDHDEILERIDEFIKLGNFENARFYANKLGGFEEAQQLERIDIFKELVFKGKNKQAGIKLWQAGLTNEAKKQFELSGDTKLIEFLDSLETKNQTNLDGEIVKFWGDFKDNPEARELIIEMLQTELKTIKESHLEIKQKLSEFKEKKNGRHE